MSAYLEAYIEVTDPVAFEEYRRQVPAVIAAHGGRYLVRGGASHTLEEDGLPEGGGRPRRHVIVEFTDMDHLKAFYASAAYQPLKLLRQRSSKGTLIAIEGA